MSYFSMMPKSQVISFLLSARRSHDVSMIRELESIYCSRFPGSPLPKMMLEVPRLRDEKVGVTEIHFCLATEEIVTVEIVPTSDIILPTLDSEPQRIEEFVLDVSPIMNFDDLEFPCSMWDEDTKFIEMSNYVYHQVDCMRRGNFRASASKGFLCRKCDAVLIQGQNCTFPQYMSGGECTKCLMVSIDDHCSKCDDILLDGCNCTPDEREILLCSNCAILILKELSYSDSPQKRCVCCLDVMRKGVNCSVLQSKLVDGRCDSCVGKKFFTRADWDFSRRYFASQVLSHTALSDRFNQKHFWVADIIRKGAPNYILVRMSDLRFVPPRYDWFDQFVFDFHVSWQAKNRTDLIKYLFYDPFLLNNGQVAFPTVADFMLESVQRQLEFRIPPSAYCEVVALVSDYARAERVLAFKRLFSNNEHVRMLDQVRDQIYSCAKLVSLFEPLCLDGRLYKLFVVPSNTKFLYESLAKVPNLSVVKDWNKISVVDVVVFNVFCISPHEYSSTLGQLLNLRNLKDLPRSILIYTRNITAYNLLYCVMFDICSIEGYIHFQNFNLLDFLPLFAEYNCTEYCVRGSLLGEVYYLLNKIVVV